MIALPVLFISVYMVCIAIFLVMPKKAFIEIIRKYIDKDFSPNNFKSISTTTIEYYKILVGGAAITAALITFISKLIFY